MKKLVILWAALLALSLIGCAAENSETVTTRQETTATVEATEPKFSLPDGDARFAYDEIADEVQSETYAVAYITGGGAPEDHPADLAIWQGVKRCAAGAEKTYRYYDPQNQETAEIDCYAAMQTAAGNGAELIVCGSVPEEDLLRAAKEFTNVKFISVDGTCGESLPNVAAFSFREEQAGYLAGYAATAEGFTQLGICTGENSGYDAGFRKGAQAAAAETGAKIQLRDDIDTEQPVEQWQTQFESWYTDGTQIIFCDRADCIAMVTDAAEKTDGYVIGTDTEHSAAMLFTAKKALRETAEYACAEYFAGQWESIGGKQTRLGVQENAVGLYAEMWCLENFTAEKYQTLLKNIAE